jgi:hypothetical protein
VTISGPVSQSVVTDGDGNYSFTGLNPGIYTVCVAPPMGWPQTLPSSGPDCGNGFFGYSIEAPALAGDVLYSGVDFGFYSQ